MNKPLGLVLLPPFWPGTPPLNLIYLNDFLQKNNIPCTLLDYNILFHKQAPAETQKEWNKSCNDLFEMNCDLRLKKEFPETFQKMLTTLASFERLGFSCYHSNFPMTCSIANAIKAASPQTRIIVGGPEITAQYFKNKNKIKDIFTMFDAFCVGEGERPLLQWLTDTEKEKPIYLFQELLSFPKISPYSLQKMDMSLYTKKNTFSLMTQRGCIRKCRFCSERLLSRSLKISSIENLMEQLRLLKSKGIERVVIHDSMFNARLSHLQEFCTQIRKNFGSIPWEAQVGVRTDMSSELISLMKLSGAYHLFIGLESGSDNTLIRMNKGYSTSDALRFFNLLKENGLSFGISIIVGYPGETEADFQESLNFVITHKNLIPKIEQINPFVYYPGIPFPSGQYGKPTPEALEKAQYFIKKVQEAGIKTTKAFLCNLVY